MTDIDTDLVPFVADISGRRSLVKPPFSAQLRSGSVTLASGEEVGAHKTENREEIIIVLRGTAMVICEDERFTVREKQLMYIPPEHEHNVVNESDAVVEYVYVVTPVGQGNLTHDHGHGEHSH
jgi:mannose-6-phosphate isomerase-like protein (cupin superfamily)